jgi:predicted transcriptional regulator
MKPPCEIVVTKMLPHIRAEVVKILTNDFNMKQIEVSERLGITQASVSQYLSSVRGGDGEFQKMFPEMEDFARAIAEKIVSGEGKEVQVALLCEVCSKIRDEDRFCDYHKDVLRLDDCGVCFNSASHKSSNSDSSRR